MSSIVIWHLRQLVTGIRKKIMIRDGLINSVYQFFEDLFRICKDKDSMNQIGNAYGMNKAKHVSIDDLLDKLSLGLGNVFIQEKYGEIEMYIV